MSKFLTLIVLCLYSIFADAQLNNKITLDICQTEARVNYPLLKQKELTTLVKEQSISNARKGYLPQLAVSAQATYQSDVTALSIPLPMFKMTPMSKDQYRVIAEVTQLLFDGFAISTQNDINSFNADAEQSRIEADLKKLKDQVNQLYFGILLTREQLLLNAIIQKDINIVIDKMNGAYSNGLASKMDIDVLKAELLNAEQKESELHYSESAMLSMLGLLINKDINSGVQLVRPEPSIPVPGQQITRPELGLYTAQEKILEEQKDLVMAKFLPKANAFFQGGYGRPGLNMLKDEFKLYYTTGIRLSWPVSSLYTFSGERELLEYNKKTVGLQRETFLLNTNIALKQCLSDIEKLNKLIKTDDDIIVLRRSVKQSAKAQLENGTITSNDFIRELNKEDQAVQNKALHEIQLLMALETYKTTLGS